MLRALAAALYVSKVVLTMAVVVVVFWLMAIVLAPDSGLLVPGTTDEVLIEYERTDGAVVRRDLRSGTKDVFGLSPDRPGIPVDASFRGTIAFAGDDSRTVQVVAFLGAAAAVGAALAAAFNLHAFTRAAMRSDFFCVSNAHRLSRTGLAALGLAVHALAYGPVMRIATDAEDFGIQGFVPRGLVGSWWLWTIVGLAFVAVGQAFRHGVELQELERTTI